MVERPSTAFKTAIGRDSQSLDRHTDISMYWLQIYNSWTLGCVLGVRFVFLLRVPETIPSTDTVTTCSVQRQFQNTATVTTCSVQRQIQTVAVLGIVSVQNKLLQYQYLELSLNRTSCYSSSTWNCLCTEQIVMAAVLGIVLVQNKLLQ